MQSDSSLYVRFHANTFNYVSLPELAKHFRREELLQLKQQHPWLDSFESSNPDFSWARDAFFSNGNSCTTALERFRYLFDLSIRNHSLTNQIYTNFICEVHEGLYRAKEYFEAESSREEQIRKQIGDLRSEKERADEGTQRRLFLEEGETALNKRLRISESSRHLFNVVFRAWERYPFHPTVQPISASETDKEKQFLEAMNYMQQRGRRGLECVQLWLVYTRNVEVFMLLIGCPKVTASPMENIAELRLFHSTRMPFIQKLQDDLQTQSNINNKQQEIITALVFRHLTENLPAPSTETGLSTSTDRWQDFWDKAIKKENLDKGKNAHPLTSLHNYISGEPRVISKVKGKEGEITEESKKGTKGQVFQVGHDLYSTLSTSIHKYKCGGECNATAYTVRDDQYWETCRELFRALAPDPENIKDGEVNWEAERKRYL